MTSTPTQPPSSPTRSGDGPPAFDCAAHLRAWLIDGRLPERAAGVGACRRADVDAVLGAAETGTGRFAGRTRDWSKYTVGDGKVRAVWDGDQVAILIAERTAVADVEAAIARLGPADATWESRTLEMDWSITDHVFAGRGVTLSIGDSLAEPPAPRAIFAVYLYEPTDVDGYIALGGKDEWVRRFPARH